MWLVNNNFFFSNFINKNCLYNPFFPIFSYKQFYNFNFFFFLIGFLVQINLNNLLFYFNLNKDAFLLQKKYIFLFLFKKIINNLNSFFNLKLNYNLILKKKFKLNNHRIRIFNVFLNKFFLIKKNYYLFLFNYNIKLTIKPYSIIFLNLLKLKYFNINKYWNPLKEVLFEFNHLKFLNKNLSLYVLKESYIYEYQISKHLTSKHLTSKHLTSKHLTSKHLTSKHLTSKHLTSKHLTSKHLTSKHLTSKHLTSKHLTSKHLTSKHLTSKHLTSKHLTSKHLTSKHLTSKHLTSKHLTSKHLTSKHSFFFFFLKKLILKKINFFKVNFSILFFSRYKINFIFNFFGFFYLNYYLSIKINYLLLIPYLRKKFVIFSKKNELTGYIIKKFVKINFNKNIKIFSSHYGNFKFFPFNSFFLNNYSKIWKKHFKFNFLKNKTNNLFKLKYVKRLKFKPGYQKIWRNARNVLRDNFNFKTFYQKKLTKYVSNFKIFSFRKFFFFFEMRLYNLLLKSKLFINIDYIYFFIYNNYIYLNNYSCKIPFLILTVNDFIQVIVYLKYYILNKTLLNSFYKNIIKFKIYFFFLKKRRYSNNLTGKQLKKKTPSWIFKKIFSNYDISKFLEVDFFTLSFFIVFRSFWFNNLNPSTIINFKFLIFNMYNWKYIS